MQISDKIKITMLPAKAGDCILIEFLKENYHILIDGGYADTYYNYLKHFSGFECKRKKNSTVGHYTY